VIRPDACAPTATRLRGFSVPCASTVTSISLRLTGAVMMLACVAVTGRVANHAPAPASSTASRSQIIQGRSRVFIVFVRS